ncbi:MAG: ECF transporter S component [Eggerthellaceae bacterium]|nr:ECF transporter S component [Eggerthellaceae bacterium]
MPRLSAAASGAALALLAVATVAACAALRLSYYVPATLLVLYGLVPLLAGFERSRPGAREVALVAALCALAVAARAAFAFVPHFKPVAGLVAIAGIACGPRTGFVVGSVAMLASNLMFGQGPWTPWQMLAYGLVGLVFGLLAQRGIVPVAPWSRRQRLAVGAAAGAFVLLVAGPLLDTSSLFLFAGRTPTLASALAIYGAGLVPNALQAAATFATVALAGSALVAMIARVRCKHGIP